MPKVTHRYGLEALNVVCDMLGITDEDVYRVEVVVDIKSGGEVRTFHRGIRDDAFYSEQHEHRIKLERL